MKRIVMMCGMLCALSLAACGPATGIGSAGSSAVAASDTGAASTAVASTTDTVVLQGSKALLIAEDAYQTVATITTALVDAGAIRGDTASKVRSLNTTVTDALVTGYAARNDAVRAANAAKALAAIADIHALIGK